MLSEQDTVAEDGSVVSVGGSGGVSLVTSFAADAIMGGHLSGDTLHHIHARAFPRSLLAVLSL